MLRGFMGTADGLRGDVLTAAFNDAVEGKAERLWIQLGIQSGLPGTRANLPLAQAFAAECVARGKAADKLVMTMATLSADLRSYCDSGCWSVWFGA